MVQVLLVSDIKELIKALHQEIEQVHAVKLRT
jgi:uncharacterized small protein (DUF1192 family)